MPRNTRKPKAPPVRVQPACSAAALHAALKPMADGCVKSAALAHTLCISVGYDKDAALAVNLAADTLTAINNLMGVKRQNAEVSEVAVADSTKTSGVRPPLSLD